MQSDGTWNDLELQRKKWKRSNVCQSFVWLSVLFHVDHILSRNLSSVIYITTLVLFCWRWFIHTINSTEHYHLEWFVLTLKAHNFSDILPIYKCTERCRHYVFWRLELHIPLLANIIKQTIHVTLYSMTLFTYRTLGLS